MRTEETATIAGSKGNHDNAQPRTELLYDHCLPRMKPVTFVQHGIVLEKALPTKRKLHA